MYAVVKRCGTVTRAMDIYPLIFCVITNVKYTSIGVSQIEQYTYYTVHTGARNIEGKSIEPASLYVISWQFQ